MWQEGVQCNLLQPDTHWIVPICEGGPPALNQPPLHCCTQLELHCSDLSMLPYTYSLPKLSICANLSCESIHICHSNTHGIKLWTCFQLFPVQAKKCEHGLKNRLERKFLAARAGSYLSFLVHSQFF